MQKELRVLAVTSVLQPEFCWKKLSDAARETHMLEGLLRTCFRDPESLPMFRLFTCDITLSSLQTDNGEGFLTLLRQYVPNSDLNLAGACTSYLHPGWTNDQLQRLREAGYEAQVQKGIAARDEFLSSFLYNTIMSAFGKPRPEQVLIKFDDCKSPRLDEGGVHLRHCKSKHSPSPVYRLGNLCETCRQCEMPGTRFSICKSCNEKMSRKIYYCSRPCQVSDWPNHKKMCGKELTADLVGEVFVDTEASLADAVFLLRRIGPAVGGYQPSPALVRQIQYLSIAPQRDYAFFTNFGPEPIIIPVFLPRLIFRLACQIAMTTGDPECVAALCELILQEESDLSIGSPEQDQLSAEYSIDVASVVSAARLKTDRHPFRSPAILRWTTEFLGSKYGSNYRSLAELSEAPSFELTRKIIHDLRQWKEFRQPPVNETLLKSTGPRLSASEWRGIDEDSKESRVGAKGPSIIHKVATLCEGCRKCEFSGTPFLVCKVCQDKASRQMYYCSRACQVADWPNHKRTCGKEITQDLLREIHIHSAQSITADDVFFLRKVGPALNGYQRSLALLRQVQYINTTPGREYGFYSSEGAQPIVILSFLIRQIFRLICQIAMCTGDPECIAALCEILLPAHIDLTSDRLAEQLGAEYGVDVVSVVADARLQTARHPAHLPAISRWLENFLGSKYGSCYLKIKNFDGLSPELTNKFIRDLRLWRQSIEFPGESAIGIRRMIDE